MFDRPTNRVPFRTHIVQGNERNNKNILVHTKNESYLKRIYKKRVRNTNLDLPAERVPFRENSMQGKVPNYQIIIHHTTNSLPFRVRTKQYKVWIQTFIIFNIKVVTLISFTNSLPWSSSCVSFPDDSDWNYLCYPGCDITQNAI